MKKIFIPESKLLNNRDLIVEGEESLKLPSFIYKRVKANNTSLTNNLAFPPEEDYSFEYKILKKRFKDVTNKIKDIDGIESLDEAYLISYLSKCIKECRELERPIRENLIKICENSVVKLLAIPDETVNLSCELVDKLNPQNSVRITPESSDNRNFDFEDLNDFDNVGKVISKRRMINALIQGASYNYSNDYELYLAEIYKLNKKLPELYSNIVTINDYLLFTKEETITDDQPSQGGYVEVILGRNGEKSDIMAQGLLFPYLLNETIRGFFELFASHGLPNDNKKAMYIIKQSDFLLAEPWDLRLGVELWNTLSEKINDTKILPYFFSTLCEMSVEEFNSTLREVFAKTKLGKKIIADLIDGIDNEVKFTDFTNVIKQKNSEFALVTDGYFNSDELNDYMLEEDDEEISNSENDITIEELRNVRPEEIEFDIDEAVNSTSITLNLSNRYQILPIINGKKINVEIINFQAEKRNVMGEELYQLHIEIKEQIRHIGLGFKLYYAFILTFGMAYCGYGRRLNNVEIPRIWEKLGQLPNVTTTKIIGNNNKEIGIKAVLN